MPKSADAFRTISEVADWLATPAHVLRFWESKFSQVRPVKRAGGRRYYRPTDMELLGGIKRLLHEEGMTIKGVQKLLRDRGVAHVAAMSPPLDDLAVPLEAEIVQLKPRAEAPEDTPTEALAPMTPPDGTEAGPAAIPAAPHEGEPVAGHAVAEAVPEVAPEAAPEVEVELSPLVAASEAPDESEETTTHEAISESPAAEIEPDSPTESTPAWETVPQDPEDEAFSPVSGLLSQLASRRAPLPAAVAAKALPLAERLAALR